VTNITLPTEFFILLPEVPEKTVGYGDAHLFHLFKKERR